MTYYNSRGEAMPESAAEQARIAGTSAGNETITAVDGNSSLSGEGGGDMLVGNDLDNRHWITDPKDVVVEQPGGGVDTEIGWTAIKLADNVENLTVNGAFNYAVGNDLDNLITVDNETHWIYGAGGDDVMVGGTSGRDTFVVRAGEGSDVIYNWNGNSQLQLLDYDFSTADAVKGAMTQAGDDLVLHLNADETLTFRGATEANFADGQFLLPLDTAKLGALTFSDDFDSLQVYDPSLQTGMWRADFGGNLKDEWAYTLTSNGERQVYTKPGFYGQGEKDLGFNPLSVSDGVLTITAERIPDDLRDAAWGREYSSGMINTLGTFEQQYGYFEMRAELPTAVGTWPAFWMMPTPYVASTEADIMEGLAATPNVDYRRAWGAGENLYDNAYKIDPSGFHDYGMLWTPQTVTFYYDGVAVLQAPTPGNWTEPMAMIVNMAVGGWGGEPNSLQFPDEMKIDYIHAYALASGETVVQTGDPEPPAATIRAEGGPTRGEVAQPETFDDNGQPVTTGHIEVHDAKPADAPAARTFVIWEDSGAVFGAVSDGTTLDEATPLMAGSSSAFTGAGTWLSDGKVVLGYMAADGDGQAAWAMIFDPAKLTFTRHELGPATGDIDFVATANGGFAASWDAPDGTTMGRGYDAFAYDGEGWYGPARELAGDLTGVTASGELITTDDTGQQQLYDMVNPPRSVAAIISAGPMDGVTHAEGDSGGTLYTFTLTRDWGQSEKSTVGWSIRGQGGAPADASDFVGGVLPSGVVTFEINQTTAYVQVMVQGDAYQEGDEQFVLTLANPVGAKLGQATATGFITNDDAGGDPPPAPTEVGFSTSAVTHAEGNSGVTTFSYVVTRTGPADAESSVAWAVSGSADGADFAGGALPSGALTFAAGETSKTITVDVAGDTTAEGDESFTVTLSAPSGASLGAATASGAITDDDTSAPPAPPQVGFAASSVTHAEGDTGLTAFSYTVTRTGPTDTVSSVHWSVSGSGDDPAAAADFGDGALPSGALTFAAGETSQVITVEVAGDTTAEADEAFTVTLSDASNATLGTATAAGVITNDDTADGSGGQVINSSGPGATLTGGAGDDTLNASQGGDVLTGGAGADHFVWAKEPWSPAEVTDFALGTDSLDLSALFQAAGYAGSDPVADKFVSFLDDGAGGTKLLFDRDGAETGQQWPNYILHLDNVAATGLTWGQLTGSEAPPPPSEPTIGFTTSRVTHAEGDTGLTAFSYTVTRTGAADAAASVDWTVSGEASATDFGGGALPSGTLSFAAGETSQVITVEVAGDTTVEADEAFTVTLSGASGGVLGVDTATGVISNDDADPGDGSSGRVIDSPGPGSTLTGGAGADTLNASQGADVLTGGAGADHFVWAQEPWSPAEVTDFAVGVDSLDLSALFQAAGYMGSDPVADRFVSFLDDGAGGTKLLFDRDGAADGQAWPNYIIHLDQVAATGLTWAQLAGGGAPEPSDPTLGLATTSVTHAEGDAGLTAFSYAVTRTGPTDAPASVAWSVAGSGDHPAAAADFQDAALPSGTLSFAAGETSKVITVNVAGDTTFEDREAFTVTLSDASGATLGTATATGVITNDDRAPGGEPGEAIDSPGPGSTLAGGAGDDTLNASQGADVLTGAGGADRFVFAEPPWSAGHITDFTPGTDVLDLSGLMGAYSGADAVGDGWIAFRADGAGGTQVYVDTDGPGGGQWPTLVTTLDQVAPSSLGSGDWVIR